MNPREPYPHVRQAIVVKFMTITDRNSDPRMKATADAGSKIYDCDDRLLPHQNAWVAAIRYATEIGWIGGESSFQKEAMVGGALPNNSGWVFTFDTQPRNPSLGTGTWKDVAVDLLINDQPLQAVRLIAEETEMNLASLATETESEAPAPKYTSDEVNDLLLAAQLPVRPCGLNADWSVRAWHLGPGGQPNRVSGDYYLIDLEDEDGTFEVVQRTFVEDGNDDIVVKLQLASLPGVIANIPYILP